MKKLVMEKHQIEKAVAILRDGGLVAFPTETVYGLGCDAESTTALERLYRVKGRPADHPVIVHVAEAAALDGDALGGWALDITPTARALAAACWPGPLTLVVRRSHRVPDAVTGGRDTVGLRVPAQPVALALLREFGGGIAAPSANRFGRVSPTRASDVIADLGTDVDLVLDGGPCPIGIESTIVDCSRAVPTILRAGGVSRERIEALVGAVTVQSNGDVAAPGTLPFHYAPRARVVLAEHHDVSDLVGRLCASGARVGVLAPMGIAIEVGDEVVVLDPPVDVDEYARVLYARLREADREQLDALVVVPPAGGGIGEAVIDRLRRAAASAR